MGVGFLDILKEIRYIQYMTDESGVKENMWEFLENRAKLWERRIVLSFCLNRMYEILKEDERTANREKAIEDRLVLLDAKEQIKELDRELYIGFRYDVTIADIIRGKEEKDT